MSRNRKERQVYTRFIGYIGLRDCGGVSKLKLSLLEGIRRRFKYFSFYLIRFRLAKLFNIVYPRS